MNRNPFEDDRYPQNPPPPPPKPKATSALKVIGIILLILFAIPFLLFGACILLFTIGGGY